MFSSYLKLEIQWWRTRNLPLSDEVMFRSKLFLFCFVFCCLKISPRQSVNTTIMFRVENCPHVCRRLACIWLLRKHCSQLGYSNTATAASPYCLLRYWNPINYRLPYWHSVWRFFWFTHPLPLGGAIRICFTAFLGRPEPPFRTGLCSARDVFFVQRPISEVPRPIATKLCHMIEI